jgi:hypothetical protein
MKKLFTFLTQAVLIVILITGWLAGPVRGQKPVVCKGKIDNAPQYKLGRHSRHLAGPPNIIIQIKIDTKYINQDDLIALAKKLKKDFCREPRLEVLIFDDDLAARKWTSNTNSPVYERGLAAMKGAYHLDRASGQEFIVFSPRGYIYLKGADTTRVNLSSDKSSISGCK